MADAPHSKCGGKPCRFESDHRHQEEKTPGRVSFLLETSRFAAFAVSGNGTCKITLMVFFHTFFPSKLKMNIYFNRIRTSEQTLERTHSIVLLFASNPLRWASPRENGRAASKVTSKFKPISSEPILPCGRWVRMICFFKRFENTYFEAVGQASKI